MSNKIVSIAIRIAILFGMIEAIRNIVAFEFNAIAWNGWRHNHVNENEWNIR